MTDLAESLLFTDVETMGLSADSPIVEIGFVLVTGDLEEHAVASWIVPRSRATWMERCEAGAMPMHINSGLILESTGSFVGGSEDAAVSHLEGEILARLIGWGLTPRMGVLAGSSVHQDRMWIRRQLPRLDEFLNYRMVDVTGVRELVKRWVDPTVTQEFSTWSHGATAKHRVLDDIRFSIDELRFYRQRFFPAAPVAPTE